MLTPKYSLCAEYINPADDGKESTRKNVSVRRIYKIPKIRKLCSNPLVSWGQNNF